MKLCIAEKPSVAKDLAAVLGANTRRDGYFEGNGYCVTWTFGHLCTLKEPEDYSPQWKSWSLQSLPILPPKFGIKLIKNSGVAKQFSVIEKLVQQCELVINCGDAGQEGELIQRWVLSKAKNTKPIKRLWISSLTEEAIKEGFLKLRDGKDFERLYAAGNSRAIGDWLLGMNATRLFTLRYGGYKQVLSIGRVQTPTLAMIVHRFLEIENFKPETYWELATIYRGVTFNCTEGKFNDQSKAAGFLDTIRDAEFTVTSAGVKKANELPPRLFDLTSIQVEGNKKFGFSADETLKLVQSLYEKKWVTYPRVDTTYLSEDIYPKIPGILKGMSQRDAFGKSYDQLILPLLTDKIRKSKKVFDNAKVTDHHAIIPTGIAPSGATYDEMRIYDLIAKRFISVFYADCVVSNTTVIGQVKELEFKVTGRQILEAGWRVVYGVDDAENTEGNEDQKQTLPQFIEGEKGPHEPILSEKQTSPPKHFTEATLLRAMETAGKQVDDEELRDLMKDNGIGRPSTRANIIETLYRRNYTKKEKKNIIPTETGVKLIQIIQSDLLKSAELTGQWERKLRLIEKGEYEADKFKEELKEMVINLIAEVNATNVTHKIFAVQEEEGKKQKAEGKKEDGIKKLNGKNEQTLKQVQRDGFKRKSPFNLNEAVCPKCKSKGLLSGKSALGCSNWKSGCDFRIPFVIGEKKMTGAIIEKLISKGKSSLINGLKENGREGDGYLKLENNLIKVEWK